MRTNQRLALLLALYSIVSGTAFSQVKEFRNTEVDSLTFLENRKLLNSLNTEKFQKNIFQKDGFQIPYRILTPKDNEKGKKVPLVITFHNSTRMGNDNEKQLEPFSKIWLRDDIYTRYHCYVLAPQFKKRSSNYVTNNEGIQTSKPADDIYALLHLIKSIEKKYPDIDKSRIYLIGYSMGGSTAQNLFSLKPNLFAAMVSVAAVPDFSNLKTIRQKNIWLIHGAKDDENPYIGSVKLYDKLSNDKNIRFTTFANLNHNNIVIPFLVTDEIPKWLFEKHQ